jgi:hypothetical protein
MSTAPMTKSPPISVRYQLERFSFGNATSGADHDRQEKVAERRRNARHEEEPDHDDPVQREHAIVFVIRQESGSRGEELEPHQSRGNPADEEEAGTG